MTDLPAVSGKPMNVWVAVVKLSESFQRGRSHSNNGGIPQSCAQPRGKVFVQTNGKRIVRRVPFGLSTQYINYKQPQMGNPKSEKNGFRKFVSSILSDVEIFDEFNGEIIL